MRPGRLDRILYVGPPDLDARKEILQIKLSRMAVDPALDLNELADLVSLIPWVNALFTLILKYYFSPQTDGCSGAELTSVCQDAALAAMQDNIDAPFVSPNIVVPYRAITG